MNENTLLVQENLIGITKTHALKYKVESALRNEVGEFA